jgi:hypothetical protein
MITDDFLSIIFLFTNGDIGKGETLLLFQRSGIAEGGIFYNVQQGNRR